MLILNNKKDEGNISLALMLQVFAIMVLAALLSMSASEINATKIKKSLRDAEQLKTEARSTVIQIANEKRATGLNPTGESGEKIPNSPIDIDTKKGIDNEPKKTIKWKYTEKTTTNSTEACETNNDIKWPNGFLQAPINQDPRLFTYEAILDAKSKSFIKNAKDIIKRGCFNTVQIYAQENELNNISISPTTTSAYTLFSNNSININKINKIKGRLGGAKVNYYGVKHDINTPKDNWDLGFDSFINKNIKTEDICKEGTLSPGICERQTKTNFPVRLDNILINAIDGKNRLYDETHFNIKETTERKLKDLEKTCISKKTNEFGITEELPLLSRIKISEQITREKTQREINITWDKTNKKAVWILDDNKINCLGDLIIDIPTEIKKNDSGIPPTIFISGDFYLTAKTPILSSTKLSPQFFIKGKNVYIDTLGINLYKENINNFEYARKWPEYEGQGLVSYRSNDYADSTYYAEKSGDANKTKIAIYAPNSYCDIQHGFPKNGAETNSVLDIMGYEPTGSNPFTGTWDKKENKEILAKVSLGCNNININSKQISLEPLSDTWQGHKRQFVKISQQKSNTEKVYSPIMIIRD